VDEKAIYRRITRRLIPYLFVLYIVAYVDRVNVGFAAMDMKRQLHFSDTVYGTGAGIFFLGYALFDLPSSLMLRVAGARRWIARIMISWGVWLGMGRRLGPWLIRQRKSFVDLMKASLDRRERCRSREEQREAVASPKQRI
jgi:sugar phosphate permease